jgi:hypothetical protein
MIEDLLGGLWNGLTAWPLLILPRRRRLGAIPVYNVLRDGGWYQLGFLVGAGSSFLGNIGQKTARRTR